LAELKDSWGVIEELKKQKAYVRTHAFGEKDREISHLGFLPGVNMANITKEVVKDEIVSMLKSTDEEVPNFEIVQVRVDMGKGSKAVERTRAYEIQCPQRHASRLAKMLQSGPFKEKPAYIPYRMKQNNPEVFKQAIKRQIKILSEQWVIKIQGFSPEMMAFAREKITESWAETVVPTKNDHLGEWKILMHRKAYKNTMNWLRENWTEILESIPPELAEGSPFDEQKVASRNSELMETGSEEGTIDTYGTILSSLYYGTDSEGDGHTVDSHNENLGSEHRPTNTVPYAQVARGAPSPVSQISGWTDQRQEEFNKLQEAHSQLQANFHKVTDEICELKVMMQKLLENTYRNQVEPPKKKQATFDTPRRNDKRYQRDDTEMDTEWGPTINDPTAGEFQQQQE
jgi:hypothetical protein